MTQKPRRGKRRPPPSRRAAGLPVPNKSTAAAHRPPTASRGGRKRATAIWLAAGAVALISIAGALIVSGKTRRAASPTCSPEPPPLSLEQEPADCAPRPKGTLTYSRDIAPIIFQNCSSCHRPDQYAPFSLLTYRDVRKHARQIAEVTRRRYMPPWPPAHGYGDFAGERRLTADQIEMLAQWAAEGAPQGDPADQPPTPVWKSDWQLGKPDLTVTMPFVFTLPAEGNDRYRNFVFPIPVDSTQYVTGVEFRSGNPKVVHHAFLNIDETRQSRRLAEKENPPGFDGMDLPDSAIMPAGQLLGWQPGKEAYQTPAGLAWGLKPRTDLVLQLHMYPSGKPEKIQPTLAFYFGNDPPTEYPFYIRLVRYDIDIPAGATHYTLEQSYVLPVDVQLLRVNPHAHNLGKDLQGYAILPSGEKKWLLWIPNWDFNWQGDYAYAHPVSLPKGSTLVMRYTYDNSANNVRNPNQPPKEVFGGPTTRDEMAALGFQALARNPDDRPILERDLFRYAVQLSYEYNQYLLRRNPRNVAALTKLGRILALRGQFAPALDELRQAVQIDPADDKPHYELGFIFLLNKQLDAASQEFQEVIRLNPDDYQAYGNLGLICMRQGRLDEAKRYLLAALRLDPDDPVALGNYRRVEAAEAAR